jgi:hypothetical protein
VRFFVFADEFRSYAMAAVGIRAEPPRVVVQLMVGLESEATRRGANLRIVAGDKGL